MFLRHERTKERGVFDPSKIKPIENEPAFASFLNKPRVGGLWTSPADSGWGWREWTKAEQWGLGELFYEITLPDSVRVLRLGSRAELLTATETYPIPVPPGLPRALWGKGLDFEAMAHDYDGFWLTEDAYWANRFEQKASTYSYDCETVLLFRWPDQATWKEVPE